MNYEESISYIESLVPTLERPTLERMKLFVDEFDGLANQIPVFHVGGTNGKGSTAAILDAMLSGAGFRVGRFTGPHIIHFNERFALSESGCSKIISNDDFAEFASITWRQSLEFASRHPELGPLTWFEFLTAMAFNFFRAKLCDCLVLEVGLGGRFDATNVAENVCGTIITNVDLDHMQILGDTVDKIAFEKSGIIRKGVPVITAAQGSALEVIRSQAEQRGALLIVLPPGGLDLENPPTIEDKSKLAFAGRVDQLCDALPLKGAHQRTNTSLALMSFALSWLAPDFDECLFGGMVRSLSRLYFPGRMQSLSDKNLIMDAAHNPAGAKTLRQALDQRSAMNYVFVLGFFANKDMNAYLQALLRQGDLVIACQAQTRRATCSPDEIAAVCADLGISVQIVSSVAEACRTALALADPQRWCVVTGSFAVLRECMLMLGWHSIEDGATQNC